MEPCIQAGALGRPAVEVAAAHAVAVAMYRHEAEESQAKPWLRGMVAASLWILGRASEAPVTRRTVPATAEAIGDELVAAGQADLPNSGDPRAPERMYARGAYRMVAYALGVRDELPVRLSVEVAHAMADDAEQATRRAA